MSFDPGDPEYIQSGGYQKLIQAVRMGDSQQPKPATPRFEIPDLELEPDPRARRAPRVESAAQAALRENPGQNRFDDDFIALAPSIDLDLGDQAPDAGLCESAGAFDALGDLELERNVHPGLSVDVGVGPRWTSGAAPRAAVQPDSGVQWPSGQAPARERLALDPLEVSLLADYGPPPQHVYATPAYAYRVFTRQRELKSARRSLEAECARAEAERERSLADLARAVRPDAECIPQFQRLLLPLLELDRVAIARGQALSSVNAELTARVGALDTELTAIGARLSLDLARESDAQRLYDEHEAATKRAEAKLQRVHIEIRALTQATPQKLGPQGGRIPEPEPTMVATLNERARALQPEVEQAKSELRKAKAGLDQASAHVGTLRQNERLIGRKKQALVQHYQQELDARSRNTTESEQAERRALVELGRAVLAARGAVALSEAWFERIRSSSARADALAERCELYLRAQGAYDRPRAAQGVRLAGTFLALCAFLVALKLAL